MCLILKLLPNGLIAKPGSQTFTIIKGNSELLSELDLRAHQAQFNNNILNAVECCPRSGKVLLYIDSNDKNVQFIAEDSGRGFTKEELHSATEQFFQGDRSRNSKNHYGMGLYIARKFLEKHNGKIILRKSEKLGGAKVILEIPV